MPIAAALAEAQHVIGRLEARALLRRVLQCDEAWLIAHGNEDLTVPQTAAYGALIGRRAAGEPVAYLTGSREFYGREFMVITSSTDSTSGNRAADRVGIAAPALRFAPSAVL